MKFELSADPARALWMLCGFVLLLSYAILIRPAESAIAEATAQTALLEERTRSQEAALRRFAEIKHVEVRMRHDLRGIAVPHSAGETAANLLTQLAAASAGTHVDILSVEPHPAASAPPPKPIAPRKTEPDLHFDPIVVTVRGKYDDVIQFIRASSLTPTPARVSGVNLERSRAAGDFIQATIDLQALRPIEGEPGV